MSVKEQVYVRTGTLRDARSISLDQTLPLSAGRVRVTIEPAREIGPNQVDLLNQIWEGQRSRGHRPPTAHTVREGVDRERTAWE